MIASIELQVLSKLLLGEDKYEIDELCAFDESFYAVYKPQIKFVLDHWRTYKTTPDVFTFQARFPDVDLVKVNEPLTFLQREIKKNKQVILLRDTFNTMKDLGDGDVLEAWAYLTQQCDKAGALFNINPTDIVHEARKRAKEVQDNAKQPKIPTGFKEIDKLMYGGLNPIEEFLVLIARTNNGKSWICVRLMESAQKAGFPVLYYSPEMQSSYIGARFDTWRGHFQNSQLFQGKYTDQYLDYLASLETEETPAYLLENKHMPDGVVDVPGLSHIVRRLGIKLLIIDGLSYMSTSNMRDPEHIRLRNVCIDLFNMGKANQCAVVVAVQANRETRECKDDKGQPFPSLYNIAGSDGPATVATQAFAIRQIFDKHILDIRLEKTRMANNQNPVLSYAWDINTGNMQYIQGDTSEDPMANLTAPTITTGTPHTMESDADVMDDFSDTDGVEF